MRISFPVVVVLIIVAASLAISLTSSPVLFSFGSGPGTAPVASCVGQRDGTACRLAGGGSGSCRAGKCEPSVPDPSPCNADKQKCLSRNGQNAFCCDTGDSCGTYGLGVVWCIPSTCPPSYNPSLTKRCIARGGADAVCCLPSEDCSTWGSYAWCDTTKDSCNLRGKGDTCGDYGCCQTDCSDPAKPCGTCDDYGAVYKCNYKQCASGQELCKGVVEGDSISICCNSGTCISSTTGAPTCSDGNHNPA